MSERTLPPSLRRVQHAQRDGFVPTAPALGAWCSLLGLLLGLYWKLPPLTRALSQSWSQLPELALRSELAVLQQHGQVLLLALVRGLLWPFAGALLGSVLGRVLALTPWLRTPSFASTQRPPPRPPSVVAGLFFLLSCAVFGTQLPSIFQSLPIVWNSTPDHALRVLLTLGRRMALVLVGFFGLSALLDTLLRRWLYQRSLLRTRAELLQELREDEGLGKQLHRDRSGL